MDNMDSNQVEIILGSLCSKNAKGDYCMELLEQIDNSSSTSESPSDRDAKCASNCDEQSDYPSVGSSCSEIPCPTCDNLFTTSCKTCATTYGCGGCLDCNIANSGECNIQSNKIKMMKGLGCCFGTFVVMSSVADARPDHIAVRRRVQDLKTCGVTVSTTPCPMAGIEQVEVKAQTKLSGITIALFDSAAQTAFKKGMAKTAGVSEKKVAILDYSEVTVRRAAGLQVDSQVLLTGSAVDTASAVNAKISDTTALAANIQAEAPTGSAMKTVAVTSSSGTMVKVAADTTQVGGNGMTAQVSVASTLVGTLLSLLHSST